MKPGVTLSRSRTWSLLALLFSLLSMPAWAAEPGSEGEAGGTVLVIPGDADPMPEITATVQLLKEAGFEIPGHQTEFLDGRRLLRGLGDGLLLFTSGPVARCPAGGATPDLGATIKQVERDILLTNYEEAQRRLTGTRTVLPCLGAPVDGALLYRFYFLQGITEFFQGRVADARRWFQLAQGIDPEHEFDRTYPPPAWELYLEARAAQVKLSPANFRPLLPPESRVWIDGRPVSGSEPVHLGQGEHLVQAQLPAGGEGAPALQTWLIRTVETDSTSVWLVDAEGLRAARAAFGAREGSEQDLMADLFTRWAREKGRAWVLVVMLAPAVTTPRVVYLDVKTGEVSPPPSWMVKEGDPEAPVFTLPEKLSGRRLPVPRALYGWHLAGGANIQQHFVSGVDSRLLGIEVGGFRRITGPWDARVGIGLGSVLGGGSFLSLHIGTRRSWEIDQFGVYAEGGLLGFKRSGDISRLGLEARGGCYYKLDPKGKNSIEAYLGAGFLFVPAGIMQFGMNYERAF